MSVGEIETRAIDAGSFAELRTRFRGALLLPGEERLGGRRRGQPGRSRRHRRRRARGRLRAQQNFLSDEDAAGVQAAYGDRLDRLTVLKDRCDPANVFRLNANIPPSDGGAR